MNLINQNSSSKSSIHNDNTDNMNLSPPILIIFRYPQAFKTKSSIRTELVFISSFWLSNTGAIRRRCPLKNVAHAFILVSPSVSHTLFV